MRNRILFLAIILILPLFVVGCDNNNNSSDGQARTENDFFNAPSLKADPEKDRVVMFLESPTAPPGDNRTGGLGNDVFTLKYKRTINHNVCWEDDDIEAEHFMVLEDSDGNEILRADANGGCVTELIGAGEYVMTIHHDGKTVTTYPIFIIPITGDIQEARETNGLINKFKVVIAHILKGIQNTVSKNARAQLVATNMSTLITTKSCEGCELSGADLSKEDLSGADLSKANLSNADLSGADLSGATWCDQCMCAFFSTGTCDGCALANTCIGS